MKKLKILALIFLVSAFSFSQSINVTFQVDMSYQVFNGSFPAGANVVVRGNFQTDAGDLGGNWQGNLFQLSDADSDEVYTGTFPILSNFSGNTYEFTYVIINQGQNDYWEVTSRQFILDPPVVVNPIVFFNDEWGTIITEVTNTINFTADISSILGLGIGGAFDPNQDSLLVMGLDWDNYGKNVIGNRRMENTNPFNPGIYTTTLTVTSGSAAPNGIGDSTKWKFKAYPDSRFQSNGWEMGNDRWHIYEADGSTITLPTIVPLINPRFDTTTIDVDLTINVDMVGAVNRYNGLPIPLSSIEFVGIRGNADFLGNWNIGTGDCWCVDDTSTGNMKVLTKLSESIWKFHTILPAGSYTGAYQYKFAAMYPGADTVHGGINPLDNEAGFGINHVFVLSNTPTIIRNNYFGDGTPPNVERIENLIPSDYKLEQNYPNPFNPSTKIRYSIPEFSFVTLRIFNLLGEEIETIVNSEQSAGVYEATFDASQLTSGVYFYNFKTNNSSFSKKMMLIR